MNVVNVLTIDVEDYFHIHAFSDIIRPEDWDSFEPRVEHNTYRLLDILDSVKLQSSESRIQNPESRMEKTSRINKIESDHVSSILPPDPRPLTPDPYPPRATFFVLGWVAERYPDLVREIHTRGHEVACHGYNHQLVFNQTRREFTEDIRRSKQILEDLIGAEVIGYRAPTYSITEKTIWALEVLFELGFLYDSSIFPVKHDFYGLPEAPRFPFFIDFSNGDILSQFQNPNYLHKFKEDRTTHNEEALSSMPHALCPMPDALRSEPATGLFEFPISTIRLFRRNYPFSGGGYFRFFPYWYTKWGFKKLNTNGSQPTIFYIHPWELDPDLPKINGASGLSRFRTYVNLKEAEGKFMRLLNEFAFAPLSRLLC